MSTQTHRYRGWPSVRRCPRERRRTTTTPRTCWDPGSRPLCWAMDIDSTLYTRNCNAGTVSLGTRLTDHDVGAGKDCNPGFKPAEYPRRLMLQNSNDATWGALGAGNSTPICACA